MAVGSDRPSTATVNLPCHLRKVSRTRAPKTGSRSGLTHSAFEDEEPAVFIEGEAEDGAAPVGEGLAVQQSVQQTIAEVRR